MKFLHFLFYYKQIIQSVQISYHTRPQNKPKLNHQFGLGFFFCVMGFEPSATPCMHDERGSLGLVPCRCRGQKKARHELRSSRILHRINRGEQNLVTTRRDMFARTKLTYSPASAPNIANRFRYRRKKSSNRCGYWIFYPIFSSETQ